MILKAYHRPENLATALALLQRPGTAVLGGGTYLVPRLHQANIEEVVDLQGLGLNKIESEQKHIRVGSMVPLSLLLEHAEVPSLLKEAIRHSCTLPFRNRATLGGAMACGDCESEILGALLVLETTVFLSTKGQDKALSLEQYWKEPARNKSIITGISFAKGGKTAFDRVSRTPMDKAIVAVFGRKDEEGKTWLAFCGVAEHPVLMHKHAPSPLSPSGDFRGSREYRQEMAVVLSKRVLIGLE